MKRMNSTSFQGLENQKTSENFWYKEEEEVQRDSKNNVEKLLKIITHKGSRVTYWRLPTYFQRKAFLLQNLKAKQITNYKITNKSKSAFTH